MTNTAKQLTKHDLAQFTGDLKRYRHELNRSVIYTPGVQFLAETAGAYWLIDAIASYLSPSFIAKAAEEDSRIADMHFWNLTVHDEGSATLEARADSPCQPFVRQRIQFTDFPMDSVNIWAANDGVNWTLYLPSEH